LKSIKTNNTINRWERAGHFSNAEMQIGNKYLKKCPASKLHCGFLGKIVMN
jgi:hypothetical protein